MNAPVLGIDVSKLWLDVCLLSDDGVQISQFDNTPSGFTKLRSWLKQHQVEHIHACLEATGMYGDEIALVLYQAGHQVSVINPARIKAYAQSRLQRNKTDQLDAGLIAEFCRTQQPPAWQPPPSERLELRAMVRRLQDLKTIRQQERNRLSSGEKTPIVLASVQTHIDFLDQQIKLLQAAIQSHIQSYPSLQADYVLLTSITGIGDQTAFILLSELPDIRRFASVKQLIAYAGLNPSQKRSGKRASAFTPISKAGNPLLRTGLYMAGLVAKNYNPPIRALRDRLEARGKAKKEITVAAMAKLLRIVFGILKSRQPFDPTFEHLQIQMA